MNLNKMQIDIIASFLKSDQKERFVTAAEEATATLTDLNQRLTRIEEGVNRIELSLTLTPNTIEVDNPSLEVDDNPSVEVDDHTLEDK